ncbi:MAG TPA: lytic transglycosylase domain-containing protein [Telluria sp.]|nr:lytic transglycosylase domain-containing protein [Telluria sp.]
MNSQPITLQGVAKAARGLLTTAQHTLTVFGLSAVAMLALLYARPDVAKRVSEMIYPQEPKVVMVQPALSAMVDPHQVAEATEAPSTDDKLLGNSKQQQWVTSWLSKKYRVADDAANMLVSTAYLTAREIKLDPLLILAVMAIESGLNPFAESPMGAKGLMQVMASVHHDKFQEVGGQQAALNPVANIRVGAQILKDYVSRSGSVEEGLKTYVGAGAMDSDSGYGSKVLAEYRRLKQVAGGKKVPTYTPPTPAQIVVDKATPAKPAVPAEHAEAIAGL